VSRLGARAPPVTQAMEALAAQRGEVIAANRAAVANALGQTTQVSVRSVCLISERSHVLTFGEQVIELPQAPRWHLASGSTYGRGGLGTGVARSIEGRACPGNSKAQAAAVGVRRTCRGCSAAPDVVCAEYR